MSRIFSIGLIGDVTKPCAVGCVTDTFPPKRRCCVFCFILPWSLSFEQCFCARSTSFVPTQVHAHARCWKSTNNTWRAMIYMIKHLRVCVVVVVFFFLVGREYTAGSLFFVSCGYAEWVGWDVDGGLLYSVWWSIKTLIQDA